MIQHSRSKLYYCSVYKLVEKEKERKRKEKNFEKMKNQEQKTKRAERPIMPILH